MDPSRFDALTRSLTDTRTRRGALAALLGGTLGLLGLADMAAKKGKGKKKKGKGKKKKKKPTCRPSCTGGKTCQGRTCVCPGGTQFCTFQRACRQCCSDVDCCGQLPCPSGSKTCLANGTCGCRDGTTEIAGRCAEPCDAACRATANCCKKTFDTGAQFRSHDPGGVSCPNSPCSNHSVCATNELCARKDCPAINGVTNRCFPLGNP